MERMVAISRRMNLRIDLRDVEKVAASDNLCRRHLARALVAKGICRDMQDAFAKYIGDDRRVLGAPPTEPKDANPTHPRAGGVASIAQPEGDGVDRAHLIALAHVGLDGCRGLQW